MRQTFKLNSNLFSIISVAMYNTALDPDILLNADQIQHDFEQGESNFNEEYFWSKFDNDAYTKMIEERATTFLSDRQEDLRELIPNIDVIVGDVYSPKYYNFKNDEIDLTVALDTDDLIKALEESDQDFLDHYLVDNYRSRDGFMSFTPHEIPELIEGIKEGNEQSIGAALTFIYRDLIEEYHEEFTYFVMESVYYSEFMDYTEIDEEEKVVETYVNRNYPNLDLEELIDSYDFQALTPEVIERLMNRGAKDIESHTGKLFK